MLKFIQNNREITALLAVVLLFVLPGFLDRQYLSVQTLTMVYSSAQILILLAMGATLVMLTRNIDVSVGSITGMCAVLLGMLLNAGYSLPVACVATLLLGLLAGFFNGVLVAWLKIPAIVATLGTLGLYRGIMLLWTGRVTRRTETALRPAAAWRFSNWLVDDNSGGIYGLAAGKDGVWTQFLCHGR